MSAKKGVGMLLSATKSGLSALSVTVNKARKSYANKHESNVLAEFKNKGLKPEDYLFEGVFLVSPTLLLLYSWIFPAFRACLTHIYPS